MSFELMSNCIGSGGFVETDLVIEKPTVTCSIENKKTVGGYDITGIGGGYGSIILSMTKKPAFIHRFFCRVLLGWKWIDQR